MDRLYLPTLHWFAMNNPFTGSLGAFRFRAKPNVIMATAKEVNMEESSISVEIWHGPFCYEKSEIEEKRDFSMSEQGLAEMRQWLESNI